MEEPYSIRLTNCEPKQSPQEKPSKMPDWKMDWGFKSNSKAFRISKPKEVSPCLRLNWYCYACTIPRVDIRFRYDGLYRPRFAHYDLMVKQNR